MNTEELEPILEEIAPSSLAESWDRPGWQVRCPDRAITGILVAMDVAPAVLDEAERLGCNLILAHHPLMFRPLQTLDLSTPRGRLIARLIRGEVSVWAAHTNLDVLPEGTSMALARALGLLEPSILSRVQRQEYDLMALANQQSNHGFGAVGQLPAPMSTSQVAVHARSVLASPVCQMAGDLGRVHQRVAVMGGSGASFYRDALRAGATLFITADVKYHEAQDAVDQGLDLVILDHFATERPVLDLVAERLRRLVSGIPVSVATAPTSPFKAGGA